MVEEFAAVRPLEPARKANTAARGRCVGEQGDLLQAPPRANLASAENTTTNAESSPWSGSRSILLPRSSTSHPPTPAARRRRPPATRAPSTRCLWARRCTNSRGARPWRSRRRRCPPRSRRARRPSSRASRCACACRPSSTTRASRRRRRRGDARAAHRVALRAGAAAVAPRQLARRRARGTARLRGAPRPQPHDVHAAAPRLALAAAPSRRRADAVAFILESRGAGPAHGAGPVRRGALPAEVEQGADDGARAPPPPQQAIGVRLAAARPAARSAARPPAPAPPPSPPRRPRAPAVGIHARPGEEKVRRAAKSREGLAVY